ncbi:LacI family DNA-binding transcriptional regulator [Spirochaeta isovalerica]|uniref:LacI family transcriptional regulator n=1 Tax=Spirochaeta isovalerica TaxID=150 RepID=A0A841R3D2_9SPIO|nr:LacI family DNA-binding transcriptional regulator [Spirochaeta isovalerica]MBB6479564.1 LacI family transcriptional regulator [Spirochaeta isovalerica]
MPNIREVASRAGVSVATVSRVLNHPERVSPKTKEHIEAIMKELDFSPNVFARSLNLKRSNTVALVIPDIVNPQYMEIARGVEQVAHEKGYNLLLCNTEKNRVKEQDYIRMLIDKKIDGIILAFTLLQEQDFDEIRRKNIPLVLFGQNILNENINSVYSDFREGAFLAVSHLINLGFRKIAYIGGDSDHLENRDKTLGYTEALLSGGLTVSKELMIEGADDVDSGYLAALKLLKLTPPPDAVFAANDLMAMGAVDALKTEGLRIPEDISVIGYDNIRMASLLEPKLTTVSWPVYKMGLISARILIDEVESEEDNPQAQNIYLRPRLKIRKSCGHETRVSEIFDQPT